jgi:hypothetical protein
MHVKSIKISLHYALKSINNEDNKRQLEGIL